MLKCFFSNLKMYFLNIIPTEFNDFLRGVLFFKCLQLYIIDMGLRSQKISKFQNLHIFHKNIYFLPNWSVKGLQHYHNHRADSLHSIFYMFQRFPENYLIAKRLSDFLRHQVSRSKSHESVNTSGVRN